MKHRPAGKGVGAALCSVRVKGRVPVIVIRDVDWPTRAVDIVRAGLALPCIISWVKAVCLLLTLPAHIVIILLSWLTTPVNSVSHLANSCKHCTVHHSDTKLLEVMMHSGASIARLFQADVKEHGRHACHTDYVFRVSMNTLRHSITVSSEVTKSATEHRVAIAAACSVLPDVHWHLP